MAGIHSTARKSKQRSGSQKELFIALALIGGVVLLVAAAALITGRRPASTEVQVDGNDIVYGNQIRAVHDMGSGPKATFLSPGDPQPDIEVPETFHDFGQIGAKDVVSRTFLVRNVGEAPLTISHAYTTCGCTVADISADVIPPGKAATIELHFDAGFHDAAGQTVRRGLILESNDPDQPQAEIWIQADVGNG
ncbi:MAG: DUF1573 domain-containing protein [Chloroflexota bacterium]|jgi:hypothetical protein